MAKRPLIHVLDVQYHRNGSMGDGFFHAVFRHGRGEKSKTLSAIWFPVANHDGTGNKGSLAVFQANVRGGPPALAPTGWEGDYFRSEITSACNEWSRDMRAHGWQEG